jgi:hypothetical protein
MLHQLNNNNCGKIYNMEIDQGHGAMVSFEFINNLLSSLLPSCHSWRSTDPMSSQISSLMMRSSRQVKLIWLRKLNIVKKFVDTKKMPHLLFHGPPGTGKTSCKSNGKNEPL